MYKKLCLLTCFIVIVSIANIATALDQPIAYYSMDEGAGTTVADSSGNGHNGTIVGTVEWIQGAPNFGKGLDFPGAAGNNVNCGTFDPSGGDNILTVSAWFKVETLGGYQCIAGKSSDSTTQWQLTINASGQVGFNLGSGFAAITNAIAAGEWHHVAIKKNGTDGELFLDGVSAGTRTGIATLNTSGTEWPVYIGAIRTFYFNGIIDEVAIFHAALSQADIQAVKDGALKEKGPATGPKPGNGAKDIAISNTILSWKSGPYAYTHDVFFGTDFNDVNDSTAALPLGETIVSAGQAADANTFNPGKLDYGTTYYWRVDEANKPPDTTVFKGKIWSFTTESEGVELAVKNVIGVEVFAPQGAVYEDQEPNTTYNGIGVDANGMHSNDAATMWAGVGDGPGDVWIQYELDQIYKLYQLKIWNYNEIEPGTPFGPKDVNITYSVDNIIWKALDEIQVFPKAPGESTYKADIFVDMNGAIAKYVRLTFLSSYTDDLYTGGISEIRFLVIPTRATVPSPEDKAVNVDLDSLISWKAGRNVGVHKIYISYDKASVDNRDIGVMSETIDPNYPITLGLGKTYYWRVDEVNDAEEYTTWDGPVWQFSTQQYVVVDNFDSGYGNDPATNAVFLTWKDAGELGNTSVNGSWMGRKSDPYLQTINHSSRYSAPMEYDNASVSYSEVKAETSMLDIGSDWSKGNPTAMEIWFRADANDVNEPVTDKLYASLSGGSRIYFDGDPSAIRKTIWTKFEVPLTGVNLTNVTSVTIGVEKIGSTGGKGVIYLDDIRLGVAVPASDPGTENLIARYEMENNVNDTSASGFNGTAFGIENGGLTYEAGKYGNALVFDGNNDYVELPIGETISTLTSCTISTWVNYGGGAVWQKVYDFGSDTNKYMDLSANNNASAVRCSITTSSYQNEDGCNSSSVLSIGNWEHIVVVIDKENATMKLYRNGDLSASDDAVTIFPENLGVTTSNWLGRSVYSDNPYFKGKIDDFRIYDRALSAGEVKYLYKN